MGSARSTAPARPDSATPTSAVSDRGSEDTERTGDFLPCRRQSLTIEVRGQHPVVEPIEHRGEGLRLRQGSRLARRDHLGCCLGTGELGLDNTVQGVQRVELLEEITGDHDIPIDGRDLLWSESPPQIGNGLLLIGHLHRRNGRQGLG